jgi:hypothetical protein
MQITRDSYISLSPPSSPPLISPTLILYKRNLTLDCSLSPRSAGRINKITLNFYLISGAFFRGITRVI